MNAGLMASELWDLNPHLIPSEFRILTPSVVMSCWWLLLNFNQPSTNE
ncbi:hypothetical protein G7B40_008000 [Aetokthonos hydrillicola Thurmond2011]|jgi:hypothetical protein|uniref:Uncharacterized protein n=1 Tax=Aetokthonos hydrillicola Thurmond2011 TaxID=2712845 RepID=A0AAP5M6X1_9CYAN|nr:hypothetical protein [Aetokthonos hydrillicola]MBO3460822.1 hypothetical protein [Aetokthonos hydrillicola CCALA 1050]MBW4585615.1 hypothetical protein [Aetokthonos hydrillicola CCALA 1050]MDR9894515.1 hypothetical protein [Aetokthonos hydrillicola Thurmond2011]